MKMDEKGHSILEKLAIFKRTSEKNLKKIIVICTILLTIFPVSNPAFANTPIDYYQSGKVKADIFQEPGTPTSTPGLEESPTSEPVETTATATDVPAAETPEQSTPTITDTPEPPTITDTLEPPTITPTIPVETPTSILTNTAEPPTVTTTPTLISPTPTTTTIKKPKSDLVSQASQDIIPADRRIDWSYAGIPGGIPQRTTICKTIDSSAYGKGKTDATAVIQTALNDCPDDQVVYLPAGTYLISGTIWIGDFDTLRGAGPGSTILKHTGSGSGTIVCMCGIIYAEIVDLHKTHDIIEANKDSQVITLASTAGINPGDILLLNQLNDGTNVDAEGTEGKCTFCGYENGDRALGQYVEVTAIAGNLVYLNVPLHWTYDTQLDPWAYQVNADSMIRQAGLEDLMLTQDTPDVTYMMEMQGAQYSWVKNVEIKNVKNIGMYVIDSLQNEIRENYVHTGMTGYGLSNGYGILLTMYSSNNLIDDNIFSSIDGGGVQAAGGASGNVFSYNYFDNIMMNDTTWLADSPMFNHGAHPKMNLWEGNIAFKAGGDFIHGSSSHNTIFRSQSKGWRDNTGTNGNNAIEIGKKNYYMNVVGSVLGTLGKSSRYEALSDQPYNSSKENVIWALGAAVGGSPTDPNVASTLLRHGNFDYVTNSVTWDPTISNHDLPASLYLSQTPDWWCQESPWPPIGPDVAGLVNKIPAERRFEGLSCQQNNIMTPTPVKTNTPSAPTATKTRTPVPPTATRTNTPVTPTPTKTRTPVPPTATRTNTPVTSSATPTKTPVAPTATRTNTPKTPTATPTKTPVAPTATRTNTPKTPTATATATSTPLSSPNLVGPANNGTALTTRPTFSWNAVSGATGYTFQLSTSSAFSSFTTNLKVTTPNYTVTSNLALAKTYYWRVMANGSKSSAWSQVFSFTSANPPAVPSLAKPTNGTLLTDYQPRLDWHGSASTFQIQVASSSTFSDSSIVMDVKVTYGTHYDIPTPLPANGTYYWHVRGFDAAGEYSLWSSYLSFKTAMVPPTLLDPHNNTSALTTRPTFDWNTVSGATGYKIQISKSSTFSSKIVDTTVTNPLYTPTTDLPRNTLIYWRASATGSRPSTWSQVFSFTSADPPLVPALVNPTNNSLVTSPSTDNTVANSSGSIQSWKKVTGADHYQLQVATDRTFPTASMVNDVTTTDVSYPISIGLTPNTTFFWRVRSFAVNGQYSLWSSYRTFRTSMLPPALLTPAMNVSITALRPSFDWNDVTGASGYVIQVSTHEDFSTNLINSSITKSTYTPTINLPRGVTIYWRVYAKGTNPSSWAKRSFKIQ